MPASLLVTIRGAKALPDVDWLGSNDPFAVLDVQGQRFETDVDRAGGREPVWNQTFKVALPAESPGALAPTLSVTLFDRNRIMPDKAIGSGGVALSSLLQEKGISDLQIPLKDSGGADAGWVIMSVQREQDEGLEPGSVVGGVPVNALPPASLEEAVEPDAVQPNPLNASIATGGQQGASLGAASGVGSRQVKGPEAGTYRAVPQL